MTTQHHDALAFLLKHLHKDTHNPDTSALAAKHLDAIKSAKAAQDAAAAEPVAEPAKPETTKPDAKKAA